MHDLEALVLFVRVAEMASFTRASTAIRQLEKEVVLRTPWNTEDAG